MKYLQSFEKYMSSRLIGAPSIDFSCTLISLSILTWDRFMSVFKSLMEKPSTLSLKISVK